MTENHKLCLIKIRQPTSREKNIKYGYKTFIQIVPNRVEFSFQSVHGVLDQLEFNKEYTAKYKFFSEELQQTISGFHVLTNKKDAIKYAKRFDDAVYKVKISNIKYAGITDSSVKELKTLLAEKITVVGEPIPYKKEIRN